MLSKRFLLYLKEVISSIKKPHFLCNLCSRLAKCKLPQIFINPCISQLMLQYIYSNYLFPIEVSKVLLASGAKIRDLVCANLPQPGEY